MTVMTLPATPWTNGQTTTDGRFYYDSSAGGVGAWRSTPLPVGGLPAGSIIQWSSNTAPANWLICDGSAVSRTTYSSLFAVIGTTYGTGDGSTTFNLPDLRGRVPVGKNGGTFGTLAGTGGAETHTLSVNEMPSHTHIQDAHTHNLTKGYGGQLTYDLGSTKPQGQRWETQNITDSLNIGATTATNQNTGGGQAHNNLQPYLVVNYIIKATAGWTAGDSELATRVGSVEARATALEAKNPGTTGQPFTMAAGISTIPTASLNAGNANGHYWSAQITVTLPTSRFSVKPVITATADTGGNANLAYANIVASSASSFSYYVSRNGGALPDGSGITWTAVQMTSTTAGG